VSTTLLIKNGDWVINPANGRPVTVSDRQKLEQDLQEDLSIAVQTNGFGAGLDGLIGEETETFQFQLQVQRAVRASIATMQRLQTQFLAAQRPNTERIQGISALSIQPVDLGSGTISKTAYAFNLRVRPVQGSVITLAATLVP
jgi:hypothetical protein